MKHPQGADRTPRPDSAFGAASGARRSRSVTKNPVLGIVAAVVASLTFLLMPVTTVVVNQPAFVGQASTISGNVMTVQLLGMIVTLGIGVAAVITRRGRAWGIAAVAVLGLMLLLALASALISLAGAGVSTPVR